MIIRLCISAVVVIAAILVPTRCLAGDAPAKLSDEAITAGCKDVQTSLQKLGLQPGQTIDPATIADQMKQLADLSANAAKPTGDPALGARLFRIQLMQLSGQGAQAETDLKEIIAAGGTSSAMTFSYGLLAKSYSDAGRIDDLTKLVADAEKAKLDPQALAQLNGLIKQAAIAPGKPFPEFSFTDLAGTKHALADYHGKVLLLDFWATWCGPCVAELPNVKAAYDAYHSQGFEIVGISLDQDRAKLDKFLADKGLTWTQSFDGKGWQNEVAQQFGINSIPAAFLIDGEGKLIAKGLRGDELKAGVKTAVAALAKH
ncbi:MAG: TlpA family protein disulfide reductase [Planctomycetes bacterium]|nr:TlpA family protein disulfide reductase [Planctomycetota bacterium]